ncbi:Uncharacterised protein [Mycobacterium tuberculosis]|nr:Uncharacterised protein [Mycobacterium tuberculosis]
MFSPPRMISSLMRPVMLTQPCRSCLARSPVRYQVPSTSAAAVASGALW